MREALRDKRRALMVLCDLALPLAEGAATDMGLPSFGIFVFELAIPLTTLNVALIAVAMVRCRLKVITPEHAAIVVPPDCTGTG